MCVASFGGDLLADWCHCLAKSSLDYRVPLEQSVNMRWLMVHFNLMSKTMPTTHGQTNARSEDCLPFEARVLFFADCWIDARRSCQLFVMLYILGCPFGWLTLLLLVYIHENAARRSFKNDILSGTAHTKTHTHTRVKSIRCHAPYDDYNKIILNET